MCYSIRYTYVPRDRSHRASDADSASALESRGEDFGSASSAPFVRASFFRASLAPSYASSSHPETNSAPSSSQDFTETDCTRSFSPTADAARANSLEFGYDPSPFPRLVLSCIDADRSEKWRIFRYLQEFSIFS